MTRLLNLIPRTASLLPASDRLESFFDNWNLPVLFDEDTTWIPAFDIAEKEEEYLITAELPGMDMKDIDITFTDGLLTVKGEKKQEKEDKGKDYHRIERRYGSFQRSFRVPEKVDTNKIEASYKDGILKLVLPKAEESRAKKIKVS
jgi:HSP20 family protein